jgi:protein-disulfide isomerase
MSLRRFLLAICLPAAACAKPDATADNTTTPAAVATTSAAAAPKADLVRIDNARMMGPESAKVWLIMASDFQCPFCRAFHDETWVRIERDYVRTGKIRVAFLNHPMQNHQYAVPSAEAAMCAGKQGKFWQMHDSLFASQDKWVNSGQRQAMWEAMATSLGLDMNDWRACVSSHLTRTMVEADFARSSAGGVTGTPSFFIGSPPQLAVVGAQPYATFKQLLDAAIAQAGRQP